MREDLIGYLLGALDAEEQTRVEQAIAGDRQLRQELEQLRQSLDLLESDAGHYDPPAGLATRTCCLIEQRTAVRLGPATTDRLVTTGRWSLSDVLVAGSVCLAAVLMFLPAIAQSRHHASVAYCQNNLRTIYAALSNYSDAHHGYLPPVPASGKYAAAGIYAPTLVDYEYLTEADRLFCARRAAGTADRPQIPTLSEIDAAQGRPLAELLKAMGGDYGYTLGHLEDGQLRPVRNENRPHFAVLGDAPSLDGPTRVSLNHGGNGQNLLFEDGHISYLIGCELGCGDNVFLNDAGFREAGSHKDDSVLGHSSMPPVHPVLWRSKR